MIFPYVDVVTRSLYFFTQTKILPTKINKNGNPIPTMIAMRTVVEIVSNRGLPYPTWPDLKEKKKGKRKKNHEW